MLEKKVLYENAMDFQNILKSLREGYLIKDKVTWGIIPAAGKGLRFGDQTPKQYQTICDEVILKKSIRALAALPLDANLIAIIVVLAREDEYFEKMKIESKILNDPSLQVQVIACKVGKDTRKDSVLAGLKTIGAVVHKDDWVLVHDAARPGLPKKTLKRLWYETIKSKSGGILALPVNDTLKKEKNHSSHSIDKTLSRDKCWIAQTPQMFPAEKLLIALESVTDVTDESGAMEAIGYSPLLVYGDLLNLKITQPQDLKFMEAQLMHEKQLSHNQNFFVGQGFDVHPLVKGRKLILGGVEVVHYKGLMGHSDADVLIHSIIDAVLGAAGLGDIGKLFPDSNSAYKNMDSRILLRSVTEKILEINLKINQIDSTILAERPKLRNYIDQMIMNLKEDTKCGMINIKATTTEKLGFIGREEGIAAQTIVSLVSI